MNENNDPVLIYGSIRKINDYWVFWPCPHNKLENIKFGLPHWVHVRKGLVGQLNRITRDSYNKDILLLADVSQETYKGMDGSVNIHKIVAAHEEAACKPR